MKSEPAVSLVAERDYINNPGYLKLELLSKGMRLDEGLRHEPDIQWALAFGAQTSGGIDLILPEETWANVPIMGHFIARSPYLLRRESDRFFIVNDYGEVEVKFISAQDFYERRTSSGTPCSKVGIVHSGYVVISPTTTCNFWDRRLECRFCMHGTDSRHSTEAEKSVDDVVETIEAAFSGGHAECVHLDTGFFDSEDGGVLALEPYIKAIKANFDTLLCVQLHPPLTNDWIDLTYALGVDSVAYNLKVFDPDLFERFCPGRAKLVGRDRYLETLSYAAKVFPSGTVVSDLIMGLEPVESTLRGIDTLTSMGVMPTLPISRSLEEMNFDGWRHLATEEIVAIFSYLYGAIRKNKIGVRWINHFNIVVNSVEGSLLMSEKHRSPGFLRSLVAGGLSGRWAVNLSKFRRKLRVKTITEPHDGND